ncbi:hypothetical protein MIND_00080500 [Mycena indigotica]|uniref:Polysaccharide lyase 14 domain-containing protein n=1 Tax=Mycena indigotica TaxID=2126181 RepID=A0A8H6TBD1_9AGAR|nr:uncharacterized protein MIND_00080500 [Mycena indigotica]KAF7315650.1 hypothetical protein MIND_00080500 [Mycena indigotica]
MFFALSLISAAILVAADTPESVASQFGLTTSTTLPFPAATASNSDAQALLVSQWGLSRGRIQNGAGDLSFVADPFPDKPAPGSATNSSGPVLQITYPEGSFSGDTGGAQFYNLWNSSGSAGFQSMLLSYEVAFDKGFNWVKGGKLPGLRGGSPNGCSGGNRSDGSRCFSSRIMWRLNGQGEGYTYTPTPNNICSDSKVSCNSDDFGTSLARGSFTFSSGQWNHVTMLVQMNNPVDIANGNIQVYFNNVLAFAQSNMQIRTTTNLTINGLYFSTFFGGADDSWATPETTHTYFRNLQLWGGSNPSTLAGAKVSSALPRLRSASTLLCAALLVGTLSVL